MIDPKDNNQEDIQNETVEDLKKDRTLYEYIELPDGTEKASTTATIVHLTFLSRQTISWDS